MHPLLIIDGIASALLLLCALGWWANMAVIVYRGRVAGALNGGAETKVPLWSGVWGVLWGISEVMRWLSALIEMRMPSQPGMCVRVLAAAVAVFVVLRLSLLGPYLSKLLEAWRRGEMRRR